MRFSGYAQTMSVGHTEVRAMSVSYSGELAYELHVPNEHLYLVWRTLYDATSGDYGYRVQKNVAFAFVEPALAETGQRLAVGILAAQYGAEVVPLCQYDPNNTRLRGL